LNSKKCVLEKANDLILMDWKVVPYAEVNEALETGASRDENTTKEDVIFELHEIISKLS